LFLNFPAYLFDFTDSGIAKLYSDSLGDAEVWRVGLHDPEGPGLLSPGHAAKRGIPPNQSYQKTERLGDLVSATWLVHSARRCRSVNKA
jgi:hypothetical protein